MLVIVPCEMAPFRRGYVCSQKVAILHFGEVSVLGECLLEFSRSERRGQDGDCTISQTQSKTQIRASCLFGSEDGERVTETNNTWAWHSSYF